MGNSVLDVNCSLRAQWPEPRSELSIYKHCSRHSFDDLISSFCDPILLGRIWNALLVSNAFFRAVVAEDALHQFASVVNAEVYNCVTELLFGCSSENRETLECV